MWPAAKRPNGVARKPFTSSLHSTPLLSPCTSPYEEKPPWLCDQLSLPAKNLSQSCFTGIASPVKPALAPSTVVATVTQLKPAL